MYTPRSGTIEYIDINFLIFLIHIAKYFSGSLKQITIPATMHEHISPQSQQHEIFTRFLQKRKFYHKDLGATSREETCLKKVLSHLCSLWAVASLFSLEAVALLESTQSRLRCSSDSPVAKGWGWCIKYLMGDGGNGAIQRGLGGQGRICTRQPITFTSSRIELFCE